MVDIVNFQKLKESFDIDRWYHNVNRMIKVSWFEPEVIDAALFFVKLYNRIK